MIPVERRYLASFVRQNRCNPQEPRIRSARQVWQRRFHRYCPNLEVTATRLTPRDSFVRSTFTTATASDVAYSGCGVLWAEPSSRCDRSVSSPSAGSSNRVNGAPRKADFSAFRNTTACQHLADHRFLRSTHANYTTIRARRFTSPLRPSDGRAT
jgi:hypothetical protein